MAEPPPTPPTPPESGDPATPAGPPPDRGPDEAGAEPVRPVWLDRHLWQIQPVRDILAIFAVVGLFWLGSKLSIVTVPLLLAILFAYLLEPVIQWLMRRRGMQRRGAVSAILAALVLVVLVPSALGLTLGIIQGAGFVRSMANKVQLLERSVEAELLAQRLARERVEAIERGLFEPDADEAPVEAETDGATDPATDAGAETEPASPDRPGDSTPEAEGESSVATPSGQAGPGADGGATPPAGDETADAGARQADTETGEPEEGSGSDAGERVASPPPTAREVADARTTADVREARLQIQAGDFWVKMQGFIVGEAGEGGNLVESLEAMADWLRAEPGRVAQAAAGVSVSAAQALLAFFIGTFALAFGAFLTAFFFFFVATEWVKVQHFAANLIPERNKERTLDLAVKFDRAINGFIRGRLTIAFIQAIIFSIGYFVIGVPAAFILGPAVALLSIVPYLALVGVPISITLLLLENHTGLRGHILWALLAPTAIYFIGQALDDYVLTPAIQGKSTDMSTPAILFASLAGGALFGVFGLLIAIPIAACVKIVLQEILWPRFREWAEGRSKDFLPISD